MRSLNEDGRTLQKTEVQLSSDEIEKAFELSQFRLVYQPKISLSDPHHLLGAETFVRLEHPKLGMLSPINFLPAVAELKLMLELTLEVVKQAAAHWESLDHAGYQVQLSVNIDHQLLEDRTLASKLSDVVSLSKMPKRYLTCEISNSQGSIVTATEREQITRLRMKGFRIALDDCGRSKLDEKQILELPLDELKLHREVVRELLLSSSARSQARMIKNIADRLGIPMVAMGVESPEQADWLGRAGCDCAQGFLYGPPIPAESFELFLVKMHQWEILEMDEKLHVLIVHQSAEFTMQLNEGLRENYRVTVAQSLFDAKQITSEYSPEVVVLQHKLADGSAVDFCKALDPESEDYFSTIIITDNDDPQLRIEAYTLGASDCFNQDISMDEIIAKIQLVATHQAKRKKMQTHTQDMQNAALGSMMEAAHYGDVLQFMKKLLSCNDESAMAKQVFQFMQSKNLTCTVQFRGPDTLNCFDEEGSFCNPLELNMFEMLSNKGRLYEFNGQTIVNDKHVSILIKNMPQDVEEIGRIRDFIAVVIEGLEARYQDTLRKRALYAMFEQLNLTAESLSENIVTDQRRKKQMIEQLNIDLQMSFHLLDLSEEQEQHITKIVDTLLRSYDESEEAAILTSEKLAGIVNLLSRTINSLEESTTSDSEEISSDVLEFF